MTVRRGTWLAVLLAAVAMAGCGDGTVTDTDGAAGGDGAAAADGGAGADAGGGETGDDYRASVLFRERFEDTDFTGRGWYDGPSGTLSTTEQIEGAAAFECRFEVGATGCAGGGPGRHAFAGVDAVYLSFWVKHSDSWVGSGRAYHPHLFHFVTSEDPEYIGPSHTHLTTYIEHVDGVARLALQDSSNVDTACVLLNDDSFVGCGGSFDDYVFTEQRSVCACNGLIGDVDGRDCFSTGGGDYYSARSWSSAEPVFRDEPGDYYKGDWQKVEAFFALSSIVDGVGVPDGKIRYWIDGELVISSDDILLRTGQHPGMQFDQFIVAPYIGDGSPVAQTIWIDDLTVAEGRIP